jgi:hypothetical protein
MRVRLLFVLSACLGLIVTGNVRAATMDACTLFTPADAQKALGEPVGPSQAEGRSFGAGEGSSCRYRSATGQAVSGKSVSLNVRHSETDLTGSTTGIAENLKSAGFKNVHEVAGIGSAAVWASNSILGRLQGELTVIQGKSVMLIVIIKGIPDEADALSRAKAIAAASIQRL